MKENTPPGVLRGCTGKASLPDEPTARRRAAALRRRDDRDPPMHYRCKHCHHWHIGALDIDTTKARKWKRHKAERGMV